MGRTVFHDYHYCDNILLTRTIILIFCCIDSFLDSQTYSCNRMVAVLPSELIRLYGVLTRFRVGFLTRHKFIVKCFKDALCGCCLQCFFRLSMFGFQSSRMTTVQARLCSTCLFEPFEERGRPIKDGLYAVLWMCSFDSAGEENANAPRKNKFVNAPLLPTVSRICQCPSKSAEARARVTNA